MCSLCVDIVLIMVHGPFLVVVVYTLMVEQTRSKMRLSSQ